MRSHKKHSKKSKTKGYTYGRGVGYPWKFGDSFGSLAGAKARCEAGEKSTGCEQSGLIWYPKCREGYHAFGCCICVEDDAPTPKVEPKEPE